MARCSDSRRSGCGVRTRGRASWRRGGQSPAADAHGPVPERGPVGFHPVRVLPERGDAGDAAPMEIRMIRVRGVAPEAICEVLAALKQHG